MRVDFIALGLGRTRSHAIPVACPARLISDLHGRPLLFSPARGGVNPGSGYSPGADINGNGVCERSGCPDGFIGYNCECESATSNPASCTNCAAGFGLAGTVGRCSLVNPNAYYANAFSGPAPPTPPPSGGNDDTDDDDGAAELAEMFIWLSVVILFFTLLAVIGLLHQCKTGQSDNAGGRREFEGWYGTFRADFHHFDRIVLGLRGHTHVRGAALSSPRLKLADLVLL